MIPEQWRFCKVGPNKAPFEKRWNEKPLLLEQAQGSAAIGVLCGPQSGGLLMVDNDGESCQQLIEQLSDGVGLPYTVSVTSGKPGRFQCAYFIPQQHWDSVGNKTIATGVFDDRGKPEQLDFRWSGKQSVVMGSHPETEGYKWINSPDSVPVAMAPEWIIKLISNESGGDLAQAIDTARARDLLKIIRPSEDYHEWITVGMALKSVDEGLFDDWVEWSQGARNACEHLNDYQAKWDSFKKDGVTMGTLHYLAYGSVDGEEPDPMAASIERRKAILQWVFVAQEEKYYLKNNPWLSLKKLGFDKFIGPIAVETDKGIKFEAASKHLPRKSNLLRLVWKPGQERIIDDEGFTSFNIHEPYRLGNEGGDPRPMIKHISSRYPAESSVIFDYQAFTLRYPWVKINFSLYMVGKEGTGKNLMFEPLRWTMGQEFYTMDASDLAGNFNGAIAARKLLIIDEPRNSGDSRWHMAETLKTLIATSDDSAQILIKPKYGHERLQDNLANVVILTNHPDAIRITDGRRFFACYDDQLPQDADYYTELANWMKNGGNEAYVQWLMERDLSGFNPKALPAVTNSRDAIELESRSSLADALEDAVEQIGVTDYSICKQLAIDEYGRMSDASLKRVLAEIKCVVAPRIVNGKQRVRNFRVNGKRVPIMPVYKRDMPLEEATRLLMDYYRKHGQYPGLDGPFEEV